MADKELIVMEMKISLVTDDPRAYVFDLQSEKLSLAKSSLPLAWKNLSEAQKMHKSLHEIFSSQK